MHSCVGRVLIAVLLATTAGCASKPTRSASSSPTTSSTVTLPTEPATASTSSGSGVAATTPAPTTTATPKPKTATTRRATAAAAPPKLALRGIGQLDQPLALAVRNGQLFVAEKGGRVRRLDGTNWDTALDISGDVSGGSEQGLLGVAFAPDGAHAYINYTDRAGDTHVVEYAMGSTGAFDGASRRELLLISQPYTNHNGGNLIFGRDGKLYIGMGDGGSEGDPDRTGQNLGVLLGKMLRIDPAPSGGNPYTVPPDNPFVGRSGARGEIWAYGLRNPWRYSFDRANGDLWIGDVGQNSREEIDHVGVSSKGGENYGWSIYEGTQRYRDDPAPAGVVMPVHEYATGSGGCAVTGGYVYRGSAIAGLVGYYLFGDFCRGRVLALRPDSPGTSVDTALQVASLASFGEDANGELYVLSLQGDVSKIVAG